MSKGVLFAVALTGLGLYGPSLTGLVSNPTSGLWLVLGMLAGYLLADFFTGTVHWFCDSFFSPETPLIGRLVIHPFRDHHDHPDAITGYRLLEQDSTNYVIVIVPLFLVWLRGLPPEPSAGLVTLYGGLFGFSIGAIGTNLFHKWAHSESVPLVVGWLQLHGWILSPEAHSRHHRSYTHGYCVTNGWMNRLLDPVDFFGRTERVIRRVMRSASPSRR